MHFLMVTSDNYLGISLMYSSASYRVDAPILQVSPLNLYIAV